MVQHLHRLNFIFNTIIENIYVLKIKKEKKKYLIESIIIIITFFL